MKLYNMPESYKDGWVHGFYSCGFSDIPYDDGARSHGFPAGSDKNVRLYLDGYKKGKAARNSSIMRSVLKGYRGITA
jgi:hypothetical protein